MSMPDTTVVTCPACGHGQEFVIWQSANVTLNPELKEKILTGEIVEFCCEQCQEKNRVVYPLLYHDMDRNLMFWLFPGDEPPADNTGASGIGGQMLETNQFRWVQSYNELLEKIRLADAEIDDKMFELFKCLLRRRWPDQISNDDDILFCAYSVEEDERLIRIGIVSPDGYREAMLPYQFYDDFLTQTELDPEELFPSGEVWSRVNHRDFWGNLME